MSPSHSTRRVAIVAFPGVQSLDISGPLEVFAGAQSLIEAAGRRDRGYAVTVVAPGGASVVTSSGLRIGPHADLPCGSEPLDTVIVPGGSGHRRACEDAELIDWIGAAAGRARRTASVCTGAFLLARAGLLDG